MPKALSWLTYISLQPSYRQQRVKVDTAGPHPFIFILKFFSFFFFQASSSEEGRKRKMVVVVPLLARDVAAATNSTRLLDPLLLLFLLILPLHKYKPISQTTRITSRSVL